MKRLKRLLLAALVLFGLAYWLALPLIADSVDQRMNPVIEHSPYPISERARQLHAELRVADLHGDALLWQRDLLQRHDHGHIDLPRLREGGFALQVFPSVTKSPSGLNYNNNSADAADQITLLAVAQHWPLRTWRSLHQRALYHADRLHDAADRSNGSLTVVTNAGELAQAIDTGAVAGILATEGAHPLEGDIEKLDDLVKAGYRIVGLQHFFDNELGGSLHGASKSGLTEFGTTVVQTLEQRQIIVDVAHSSEAVVRDVLRIANRPLIVSHTGIKSVCDTPRNISDQLLIDIAANGGLIGIGFWDAAICDVSPMGIAKAIKAGIALVGIDRIALGSDFDGTVTPPVDASEMAAVTQALLDIGLDDKQVRAVMGANAIRFFLHNLPGAVPE